MNKLPPIHLVPAWKIVAAILLAFVVAVGATVALAQTPANPEPTPEQLKAWVQVLRQQRDANAALAQDLQAQIQILTAELEAARKQLAATAKTETK
jgi:septal ring factor EnvC (AmiA/AmiB activator)